MIHAIAIHNTNCHVAYNIVTQSYAYYFYVENRACLDECKVILAIATCVIEVNQNMCNI